MKSNYKSNIWKYYLFKFFSNLAFIGGVLVPFFTDWGGITFSQVMILQSWFMFWIFILEIPTGAVADYLGRKTSLVLALIVNGTAAIVYASIPSFQNFLFAEFLFAMSIALSSGASEAFFYDSLKKMGKSSESKKLFGRAHTFKLIGIMVAAPIGSIIASKLGLQYPMLLLSIPLFIAALIAMTFKEPKTKKKIESKRYFIILRDGIKLFRKNRIIQILTIDMVVISAIGYFMIWLYQPMLKQADINIAYFGLVHSGLVLSQIIISNSFVFLEKILGSKRRLIFISSLVVGITYVIGGLTSSVPLILLTIILGGGLALTRTPLFNSYVNKHIPSSNRATVLSTVSMFERFVIAVFNPFIGEFTEFSLSYTLITLGVMAIVFSFISKVKEEHLID